MLLRGLVLYIKRKADPNIMVGMKKANRFVLRSSCFVLRSLCLVLGAWCLVLGAWCLPVHESALSALIAGDAHPRVPLRSTLG